MWREYVKMELNFVESLRRRWSVLGINVKGKGKEASPVKSKRRHAQGSEDESGLENENNVEADVMEVDALEEEVEEDEAARKQIMDGAIVKAVISNAAQGALLPRRLTPPRMS